MAVYATDSDLTTRVPASTAATPAQRTVALDDAEEHIDLDSYEGKAVRAHVMLAAHYLTLAGIISGGESGLLSSHSMGSIAASYAVSAPDDPLLATTIYGRQFLQIRDSLASRPEAG